MKQYCPNCHKELPLEAQFCDNCGTRLTPLQPSAIVTNTKSKKPLWKRLFKFSSILLVLFIVAFLILVFLENVYHRIPPMPTPTPSTNSTIASQPETNKETPLPTTTIEEKQETPSPTAIVEKKQETPTPTAPEAKTETPIPTEDVAQGLLKPDGDPQFDEFLFYENDVYSNGLPKDAIMEPIGLANGSWKYCLTFNRTLVGEERIDEIGLADLTLEGNQATLILHPQMIRYGSHVEPENEQDVGYQPFQGSWDNESIELLADGISIDFGHFYISQGKEYMLGNIIIKESGLFGDVLLVRP